MSTSANPQTAARTIYITPSSFASLPPTQNTSLQQPTAHQRFLNNPRHLKRLFTHTTLKSLLACQRVCKLWNQIITSSHACKEKLFLTSSPPRCLDCIRHYYQQQQQPRWNPLLTTINESVSHLHPVYDSFLREGVNNKSLILTWKGSFYTPQIFFPRASNPSLGTVSVPVDADADADRQLGEEKEEIGVEFQLRRLSRFEVCFLSLKHYHHYHNYENHQHESEKGGSKKKTSANNRKKNQHLDNLIFPGPEASLWNMYLCQPPPSSVSVTIWKAEEEDLEGDAEVGWSRQSGSTSGYVTERFMIHKAWTMREIFERMDEARSKARIEDGKAEEVSSMMMRRRKGSLVKDLLLLRR